MRVTLRRMAHPSWRKLGWSKSGRLPDIPETWRVWAFGWCLMVARFR